MVKRLKMRLAMAGALTVTVGLGAAGAHGAASDMLFDDFSSGGMDARWVEKRKPAEFSVQNGVLVARQTNPDHGAVLRAQVPFRDAVMEFDARFVDGRSFNAAIEDKGASKITHAGHLARISVSGKGVSLSDDIQGKFNLEYRKLPEDQRAAKIAGTEVRKQLATPPNDGQWHRYRFEIRGDRASVFYDGQPIAELVSPGFAHPTKTQFGFTVNGEIHFDNIRITPL